MRETFKIFRVPILLWTLSMIAIIIIGFLTGGIKIEKSLCSQIGQTDCYLYVPKDSGNI